MKAFYNDSDPKVCAWLRELVRCGYITDGLVDERSIRDLRAADLAGFERVHLFAGVGGWDYALKLAGWPEGKPVWTGSCLCQPFSVAGKRKGNADERHLWPATFNLIRECRPVTIFGEQVASAIGYGWLDGISADLEAEGYTVGASVLGAHSVGAPHKRQRLYWVAVSKSQHDWSWQSGSERWRQFTDSCSHCNVANHNSARLQIGKASEQQADVFAKSEPCSDGGGALVLSDCAGSFERKQTAASAGHGNSSFAASSNDCALRDTESGGQRIDRSAPRSGGHADEPNAWSDYRLIHFTDGKTRRIESATECLAYGVPARVVRLRGYGNAITPQVSAAFIRAFLEVERKTATK